jgi:hypothetical protein
MQAHVYAELVAQNEMIPGNARAELLGKLCYTGANFPEEIDIAREISVALVDLEGTTFGIAAVLPDVLRDESEANNLISLLQETLFVGHPVALVAQSAKGPPRYYGFTVAEELLMGVPLTSLPWEPYTLD